jgi:hypothetical protein
VPPATTNNNGGAAIIQELTDTSPLNKLTARSIFCNKTKLDTEKEYLEQSTLSLWTLQLVDKKKGIHAPPICWHLSMYRRSQVDPAIRQQSVLFYFSWSGKEFGVAMGEASLAFIFRKLSPAPCTVFLHHVLGLAFATNSPPACVQDRSIYSQKEQIEITMDCSTNGSCYIQARELQSLLGA